MTTCGESSLGIVLFASSVRAALCGEAVDGSDAIDKARGLRPDLVILDINIPVLNGVAAVRQILRGSPNTKILVFTIHDSEQTAAAVKRSGAHGYVSKNNVGAELMKAAKDFLRRRIRNLPRPPPGVL